MNKNCFRAVVFSLVTGTLAFATLRLPVGAQESSPVSALRQGTRGEILPELKLPSLIPNGDFTEGMQGWTMSQADGVTARSEVVRVNDEHSRNEPVLQLQKTGGIGAVRVVSERIPVEADTDYLLTGLYHTRDAKFGTLADMQIIEVGSDSSALDDAKQLTITGATRPANIPDAMVFNCRPGQWRRRVLPIRTSKKARFVRLALIMEGPPSTMLFDNFHFNVPEPDTREFKWPAVEKELPREEVLQRLASRPDSRAEVRQENGGPRLYIDGKPRVPFVHMSDVSNAKRGYVSDFARSGVNLHLITLSASRKHWTGDRKYNLKVLDEYIWNSVQRDPEGYFLVNISVKSYPEWAAEFPDEVAMNAAGEATTSRHGEQAPPSYYSQVYRAQIMDLLQTYVRHIKAQPYSRAIVGFMLTGGEDGQFYYQVRGGVTRQDGHSPGDLPLFRSWLRGHYVNDLAKLRAAWNDPDLTFETATPPLADKKYPGVFFNIKTHTPELDMQRFLNEEVAKMLTEGLAISKKEMGKPILGVTYYGRGMSMMVYPQFAQNSVMFKSDAIDLMGAQPGYRGWRETASAGRLDWVFDSTRNHRKIPMVELDDRTRISQYKNILHDARVARFWDDADLMSAMARDAGKALSVGGGAWWMEMTGGWFHDPQIMSLIEKLHQSGQVIAEEKPAWRKSEIVFVTDEENYFHTNEQLNTWNGPNYHSLAVQQHALNRAGISYDLMYLDDLIAHNRNDYKVYVFLNLYHADERARKFIDSQLKRDNKTLVWQYAPGYIARDGFSLDAMQTLTGIHFSADVKNAAGLSSKFLQPKTPLTAKLLAGVADEKMGLGVDMYGPRFIVSDSAAEPLGVYLQDNEISAAIKRMDGYTSIFIGHPSGMTPDFIRNIAQAGGVNPFIEAGDMAMFHRENFIVIHGVEGGRKTLHLPSKAKVTEMLTGQVLAQNSDTIPLDIAISDTLWLHIEK